MKRILYLTLTIMLCLTFFTAVTWAEEKASAASDKILSQQQVDELLQADDNPAAYVKIDEDAYKVYPDFKDKKAVRKELLKNLPTNKVLYLLTASEQTFTLAFDVVKDLEKSGRLYDNSRYMGGKDDSDAGAENIKANIHKFWFMKIPRGSTVYDDGVNVGIGIGIGRRHRGGIGIGRRHRGGIGIGWENLYKKEKALLSRAFFYSSVAWDVSMISSETSTVSVCTSSVITSSVTSSSAC